MDDERAHSIKAFLISINAEEVGRAYGKWLAQGGERFAPIDPELKRKVDAIGGSGIEILQAKFSMAVALGQRGSEEQDVPPPEEDVKPGSAPD